MIKQHRSTSSGTFTSHLGSPVKDFQQVQQITKFPQVLNFIYGCTRRSRGCSGHVIDRTRASPCACMCGRILSTAMLAMASVSTGRTDCDALQAFLTLALMGAWHAGSAAREMRNSCRWQRWFQHSNSPTTQCMPVLCVQTIVMERATCEEGFLDVMQQVGVVWRYLCSRCTRHCCDSSSVLGTHCL